MGNQLSQEELEALTKNSHFTDEEIKVWYKGFIKDYSSGKINKQQFSKIFEDLFPDTWSKQHPRGNSAAFREHMFRVCDRDKNGVIDFKEFVKSLDVMCHGTLEEKLELTFQMYDIDSNGTIDISEMTTVIGAIYEMLGGDRTKVEQHAKEVFQKMDHNKDDKITRKEFVKTCISDQTICQMFG